MISSHQNKIEKMIKWTRQIFSLGKCWNQTLVKVLAIPVYLSTFHPSEMFSSLLCLTLTSLIMRKRKFQTHKLLGKCLVVSNHSESNPPYNYIIIILYFSVVALAVVEEWTSKGFSINQLLGNNQICAKVKLLWEEAVLIARKGKSGNRKKKNKGHFKKVPLKDKLDKIFDVASCK